MARLGAAFPQEERLAALRRRQAEIEQALTPSEPEPAPADTTTAPATAGLVVGPIPAGRQSLSAAGIRSGTAKLHRAELSRLARHRITAGPPDATT